MDPEELLRSLGEPDLEATPTATRDARKASLAAFEEHAVLNTEPAQSQRGWRRRHSRRVLVLAALLALCVVVPALAYTIHAIAFEDAPPASTVTQRRFQDMFATEAPAAMNPGVIPMTTRVINTFALSDSSHRLWVGLASQASYCMFFEGLGGGCVDRHALGAGRDTGEINPRLLRVTARRSNPRRGADLFGGVLLTQPLSEVLLTFEDGTSVAVPVIWVGAPINSGFFMYAPDRSHQEPGKRAAWLTAVAPDNTVLAKTSTPFAGINQDLG